MSETRPPLIDSESWEYTPAVDTHLIQSKSVGQTFKIQVMRPSQKRDDTARYPVVYATDGNFVFDALKGISYSLQLADKTPRFVLVGIGYPGDSPLAGSLLRARDMTFPGYPLLEMGSPRIEGVLKVDEGGKDFYGAGDFQRFIKDELVPFIDETYGTIAGDRTYFGHSLGGGFGLFTLFTLSELFKRYIVSSPGLIFHGKSSGITYENHDFLLQEARKFIDSGKLLEEVKLYLSVGADEEFESGAEPWQLTSSFYRMGALLKNAKSPGLELFTEAFPRETHMTVWPLAFIHGIQSVFGTRVW